MVRILAWVIDALVILMLLRLVGQLFFGRARPRATGRAPEPDARRTERLGGALVRDPHCGTYVAESRALRVEARGETLYFCSPKCRDAFAQRT